MTLSFTTSAKERKPRAETAKALSPAETKVLAHFYGWLGDLYFAASKIKALRAANARLQPKLDDPRLARHPKRAEYVALFEQRQNDIWVLERAAQPYVTELAMIWQRLPITTQESMYRDETGFPQERNPARLALAVFVWMQSEAFLWPSRNESPF